MTYLEFFNLRFLLLILLIEFLVLHLLMLSLSCKVPYHFSKGVYLGVYQKVYIFCIVYELRVCRYATIFWLLLTNLPVLVFFTKLVFIYFSWYILYFSISELIDTFVDSFWYASVFATVLSTISLMQW